MCVIENCLIIKKKIEIFKFSNNNNNKMQNCKFVYKKV